MSQNHSLNNPQKNGMLSLFVVLVLVFIVLRQYYWCLFACFGMIFHFRVILVEETAKKQVVTRGD